MQFLESARGHYFSALTGLNAGKQEQIRSCASVDTSLVSGDHAVELSTEKATVLEEPARLRRLPEMDGQLLFPKVFLKASDKTFQSVRTHFSNRQVNDTTARTETVIDQHGIIGREVERMSASDLELMTSVCSDFGDAKESLLTKTVESRSIQKTVESLKAELQDLKREHPELNDKDVGMDFGAKDSQLRYFPFKPLNDCYLAEESEPRNSCKEVSQNNNDDEVKVNANFLKGEDVTLKNHGQNMKSLRVASLVDGGKEASMSAFTMSMFPERMYAACVSTSESSARIMNSEDELESSSQKPNQPDTLERDALLRTNETCGAKNCIYVPEFSIRDYVSSTRTKYISTNWPFSEKILTLCLKHGVKNVLPPFRPVDPWRDGSVQRCLVVESVPSEESNVNERSSLMKNHLVPGISPGDCWSHELAEGYRDLDQFHSRRDKEVAFKMIAVANCQSEVESVSTSNLPFSEVVSVERKASASAAFKGKRSCSQISNKKARTLKSRNGSSRGAPEDITSACTVPPDAMTSKMCPVCENFSSSSNTTLNAHIDQCLSSQSSPHWVNNSEVLKPRIKPRKIRSMADICATAPSCTLEDLDRRNGTNWASDTDFPAEDTAVCTEGTSSSVHSQNVVNSRDDGSVYIDSSGRKIRILSKFNETLSSTFPKPRENLKLNLSKKGKRSKFLSASRKRRLAKHLKFLRVTCQRKRLSSLKVKGRFGEASRTEETTCAIRETPTKQKSAASSVKEPNRQEHKILNALGTSSPWISSNVIDLPNKTNIESAPKVSRYDLRVAKNLQVRSSPKITEGALAKKHARSTKKLPFIQYSLKDGAGMERNEPRSCRERSAEQHSPGSCCARTLSSLPRGVDQGNSETVLKLGVPELSRKKSMELVPKSLDARIIPVSSPDKEIGFQSLSVQNNDPGGPESLQGFHAYPLEGIRSYASEGGILSPNLCVVRECQSNFKLKGSTENCSENEEAEEYYDRSREQIGAKRPLGEKQGCPEDVNGICEITEEDQRKYGFVQSAKIGNGSSELVAPDSSSSFLVQEIDVSLITSLDSQVKNDADMSASCSNMLRCLDKSQGSELGDGRKVYFPQLGVRNDNEMCYGNVTAVDRLELKTGDTVLNFEHGSSFVEVDPIPIPGPPGSELPSFSGMDSEDLHVSTSSSSGLVRCPDGDNVVGDATSTISNLCVTNDPTCTKEEYPSATLPVYDSVYQGCLVASGRTLMGNPTLFPQSPSAINEWLPSVVVNPKDRSTDYGRGPTSQSSQKGIPCTAAMSLEGSHFFGHHMTSVVPLCGRLLKDSSLINCSNNLIGTTTVSPYSVCPTAESENLMHFPQNSCHNAASMENSPEVAVPFPQTGDSGFVSPVPILRLMGKDLKVVKKDEVDHAMARATHNVCMNGRTHLVSEFSSGLKGSWEHHSPQNPAFMGSLPYEQEPQVISVQHSDLGSSNMMCSSRDSRSSDQASGNLYVNEHMLSSFWVFGAQSRQR